MYSRTVVTGETHTFEGVVNSRTESFKGRVKYTLWQGDKLVEQFPSYYFECKGKNFFNTLAIPCFVTVVPGTYRLKMLLKEEGKNNLLIYSNRTFTAKFKQTVGVYYFSSSNKECGMISQSIAYIEDWRDLEEQSGAIHVTVNPKFGYYFNGWTVKVPGSSSYIEVTKWWVDDKGTLIFNNGQVVDEYPSGSEFKAVFLASPAQPTYTITIHLAEWINGSWKNSIPTQYGVSWDKDNAYASMGTITLTKKFKAGDICTFWLVSSCDSYGCYMPQFITTVNHSIIDNIYGKYTYSFEVKSNTEYYVDITYIRND